MQSVRITVLVDNHADPPLLAEHGFAAWIEAGGTRILLDTGQGEALLPNARALGIDLGSVQHIVLSHGHYDHTGGLAAVLDLAPHANLYLHPDALRPKYSRQAVPPHRTIGMSRAVASLVRSRTGIVWADAPTAIADGVVATGQIPRLNRVEHTGGHFFLDEACTVRDPLLDDQALVIDTPRGEVLLLGCAHSGVINTCEYVRALSGRKVRAALGGMHLLHAQDEQLDATLRALQQLLPGTIAPCHCTGARAISALRAQFGDRYLECAAGFRVEL